MISVTGRLSLPGGKVGVCMPRVEKVVAHRTGTFAWCSRGCVLKGKDRCWADREVGDTTAGPMVGLGHNYQFVEIVLVVIHHLLCIRKHPA